MTDKENEQPPTPHLSESVEFFENLQQVTDYYGAPNGVLQTLADSANSGGSGKGIPITLFVHGGMISGHIESGQEFLRAMADLFREGVTNVTDDGELPEYADEYARNTFEAAATEMDEQIEADKRAYEEHGTKTVSRNLTRRIHLKDAYYAVPGAASIQLPHVCVQLNQVVGWTIGVTSWG